MGAKFRPFPFCTLSDQKKLYAFSKNENAFSVFFFVETTFLGGGFPIHGQMPEMVAYGIIGMTPPQEALLLLLQTLPTFWAEWIVTLKFFIYWISWLPEFQIFRFPDLTGLGLPLPARCIPMLYPR